MDPPPLEILYEQGPCLVVLKPPGLLTQAPRGIDSLERRVKEHLGRGDPTQGEPYLGVPHRLDRPVSGAMVLATQRRAARKLSKQFERRTVRKVYWACVAGEVHPAAGAWEDYVRKVPDVARVEVVPPHEPGAQRAVLRYRTLGLTPHGSWLEIELETGRMHQIRVQAAARGRPVLGDQQYGSAIPFGEPFEDTRLRAIALHGRLLAFRHPETGEEVVVTAPLPEAWSALHLGTPVV